MNKNIGKIIKTIEAETRKFSTPSVTGISYSGDPYKVLISCLLSLRTRDEVTAKASSKLFKLADTPKVMVKLSNKQIQQAIYSTGFYKVKTNVIKNVSKKLISDYNSKVPDNLGELLKFKGVGRKTANIVIVYAYNKLGMPIDTHCHRIPNRLGWVSTKTPEQTENELRILIPKRYWKIFNDVFVKFGQNICKPIGPKCNICPVNPYCSYFENSKQKTNIKMQTKHIPNTSQTHKLFILA